MAPKSGEHSSKMARISAMLALRAGCVSKSVSGSVTSTKEITAATIIEMQAAGILRVKSSTIEKSTPAPTERIV